MIDHRTIKFLQTLLSDTKISDMETKSFQIKNCRQPCHGDCRGVQMSHHMWFILVGLAQQHVTQVHSIFSNRE